MTIILRLVGSSFALLGVGLLKNWPTIAIALFAIGAIVYASGLWKDFREI